MSKKSSENQASSKGAKKTATKAHSADAERAKAVQKNIGGSQSLRTFLKKAGW